MSTLQPHQQRVVDERTELDARRAKLLVFMDGEIHVSLPLAEKMRLGRQLKAMSEYSDVLGERIDAFTGAGR